MSEPYILHQRLSVAEALLRLACRDPEIGRPRSWRAAHGMTFTAAIVDDRCLVACVRDVDEGPLPPGVVGAPGSTYRTGLR